MARPPIVTKELQAALRAAMNEARELRHEYVTLEHLLLAFLREPSGARILKAVGADLRKLEKQLKAYLKDRVERVPEDREVDVQQTVGLARVLQRAAIHAISAEAGEIDIGSVLVAMFREEESQAVFLLKEQSVSRMDLLNFVSHGVAKSEDDALATTDEPEEPSQEGSLDDEEGEAPVKDPLKQFTTNLNEEAAAGRIDPLIGRGLEVERVVRVLCRRRKNNPLLVGEPGVGKTAIAEGLARRIHEGDVPSVLRHATIYALDLGALLAGTKFRGQFEERLKAVLKALKKQPEAVLFIDEIHTIVGAGATTGGSMDASNMLKPALASGQLRCIGSTTHQDYKGAFERDRALARRFQRIEVGEPSVEDSVKILEGLQSRYESHHDVAYEPEALRAAVELSAKHVNDRLLPDKALDVIDEAGAQDRMRADEARTRRVTVRDVESIVAKMARIPEKSVSASEKDRMQHLETDLKKVIFGQDKAIETIVGAIKLARSGLRAADKPVGNFLFAGPTGVGKTELAKQLAKVLGVEFLRFDMSEYSERHTVSRLIGAPPGYVGFDQGGLLTDAVTRNPYSVLLLDEVEKAHPDLFNVLLQVMDHATLTDNNGKKADFRNVVLIMTTNAGAREMSAKVVGFGVLQGGPDESKAKAAIERLFTPEFRNRLDAWVLFSGLSAQTILLVVDKELALLQEALQDKKVTLVVTPAARAWLAEKGYDPAFGARPMARLVEGSIKRPLADLILFGELQGGGIAQVDLVDDALVVRPAPKELGGAKPN
ncbi:MAG: ATP-dependent Clp protease ATP-binding subunit ClpA [Deltaproteobacteria bacterium]|nr:ATP-dependent Clp protease ATP-binding subunit ClpA [Deltaproteobacteria bacterium]